MIEIRLWTIITLGDPMHCMLSLNISKIRVSSVVWAAVGRILGRSESTCGAQIRASRAEIQIDRTSRRLCNQRGAMSAKSDEEQPVRG